MQAGHAIIGALLPEYDPVTKISIIPRGAAGGATFFAPNEEQLESGLFSKSYLENKLAVALGGRVAEELILGPDDITTGASGDFQQVRLPSARQTNCMLRDCNPCSSRGCIFYGICGGFAGSCLQPCASVNSTAMSCGLDATLQQRRRPAQLTVAAAASIPCRSSRSMQCCVV